MNNNNNNNKNIYLGLLVLALLSIVPNHSYAAVPGVGQMFANFSASSIALTKVVQYSSYVIGIFLVINAIFKFSQLGSNPQLSPKVPITMFLVGVSIFSLTSALSMVQATMVMGDGPGDILMPSAGGFGASTAEALQGVFLFIRLVGYIAFVRGWLMLNQAGQGKDGMIGRGLTHIMGGVAAINVVETAKVLAATLAPGMPLPF